MKVKILKSGNSLALRELGLILIVLWLAAALTACNSQFSPYNIPNPESGLTLVLVVAVAFLEIVSVNRANLTVRAQALENAQALAPHTNQLNGVGVKIGDWLATLLIA